MRTSADIYKEYLSDKMINEEQLADLKKVGLSMLWDLHKMCIKHGIRYSLAFGTMLGAIRHKGYIPWDDDIDVFIMRNDYSKLCDIVKNEYSDKYYVVDKTLDKSYNLPFPKLIRKDTTLIEATVDNKPKQYGAYIDIFLLDEAPAKHCKMKQKLYLFYSRMASLECDFKYPSNIIKERSKDHAELKKYSQKRKFMGFFASIMPIKFWCWCRDRLLRGKKDHEKYVVSGDIFRFIDKSDFDDLALYEFEGRLFYGPKNYDKVLSSIYKDYMILPPENKRERHIIVNLDLSKVLD